MLTIDGSYGEGGGQILRSSLALSMITQQSFCIKNIRAARSSPGLQRQHLAAVNAAVEICQAEVVGNQLGARELMFRPNKVQSGEYHFSIGTAGSCMLVLQTVLPALMIASGKSTVTLEGGTHNPFAPPSDFLEQCFLKVLKRIGPGVELELERAGFYPAGGGLCKVSIEPSSFGLRPLEILERGRLLNQEAIALVARLPKSIGEREINTACRILGWPQSSRSVREIDSPGHGNALLLHVEFENVSEVVTGFGKLNVQAEFIAKKAAREMKTYLASDAPVGAYLADQLLLPLAIGSGGVFRCTDTTPHTLTNIHTIKSFIEKEIKCEPLSDETVLITIPDT
ncbi:MAG: RNA 3'-terminal phosphate cyclase [Pirellula sp.]|jgi:RNA 3'-terminal phosphate cyclase (ATP)|nr:RNA 3'-terminal phosphate cyclase [Pirellula sp.]